MSRHSLDSSTCPFHSYICLVACMRFILEYIVGGRGDGEVSSGILLAHPWLNIDHDNTINGKSSGFTPRQQPLSLTASPLFFASTLHHPTTLLLLVSFQANL